MQQNSMFETIELPTDKYPNRKFELKQLIGTGMEGQVYLAYPKNWGNNNFQVAIKIQEKQSEKEIEFMDIISKAQNSTEEQNKNWSETLIKIYHFEKRKNQSITVMELGEKSLREYLETQNGKLNQEEKLKICLDIAKSIAFLHKNKRIHRDIKTENFILVQNNIKLIDFGLITKTEDPYKTLNLGTQLFMPPEILEENVGWPQGKYDERVDVWAAGCAFYEILTGNDVFQVSNKQELLLQIKCHKENSTYVNNKINSLPIEQEFKDIISMMLKYKYQERIAMQDVVEKLQKIYNQYKSTKEQKQQQQPQSGFPIHNFQQQPFLANGPTFQPKLQTPSFSKSAQQITGKQFQNGLQQIGQFQQGVQFQGGQVQGGQVQGGQVQGGLVQGGQVQGGQFQSGQFQVNQHSFQNNNSSQQFQPFNKVIQLPVMANNNSQQQFQNQKPIENLNNQYNYQDSTIQFLNQLKQMILQPNPKVQEIVQQIEDFKNKYEQNQRQHQFNQDFKKQDKKQE